VSKRTLLSYSHAFLIAADEHAAAAKKKGLDGEVDGMMCAIALQNAVVGATRLLGKNHAAVEKCLAETRDLKNVRDMLTHFDDYALGTGNLQRSLDGSDGAFGWMPMWNSPETILILTRRKGEEMATQYEVAIHDALKAVAVLVGVAAASLNVGPSALVERLTTTV
jgi:hypothetical protein